MNNKGSEKDSEDGEENSEDKEYNSSSGKEVGDFVCSSYASKR